ncbi:AAA-like domain-containing protein [Oxynema aestuarii]|uniref:AAA family ATPase n=1 Tax=Oxynema aestuarii AP17 TaxID=2064643 RepID=A0A6H1U073_9CYAN|nr:AAA-like domain-containing protein [Oxynema aestuarii]QIZ72262.1 AAA family ATPase [Oxynema aestuarii AP17]
MTAGKRQRGKVLTVSGRNKLNEAIEAWQDEYNQKATNDDIAAQVPGGISTDTVSKIRQGRPTDLSKIRDLFAGFDLDLKKEDYSSPDISSSSDTDTSESSEWSVLEPPQGQVGLNSPLYIERPPIEQRCYETIMQPGALIRIKAPKQMGKTSLMARIVDRAKQQGCQIATVDFQIIDKNVLTNLDRFFKWFCTYVVLELDQEDDEIENTWKPSLGSKMNCFRYFEQHILKKSPTPIVLALDEVDRIFEYQDIAEDFLGLLRAWHEKGKNSPTWQKLRLILTHSTEVYIPININQSPFNVGLPVELSEFNREQVQELAELHQLKLSDIEKLMNMVGGHPYLVRVALYHLAEKNKNTEKNADNNADKNENPSDLVLLLTDAPTEAGVYSDHLRRHLSKLEAKPDLAAAMKQVVESESSISLKPTLAYQLNSMGLTKQQEGDKVEVRYQLYRKYFGTHL